MKCVILLACAVAFSAAIENDNVEVTEFCDKGRNFTAMIIEQKVVDGNCKNFNEENAKKMHQEFCDKIKNENADKYEKVAGKLAECEKRIPTCGKVFEQDDKDDCDAKTMKYLGCVRGARKNDQAE